MVAPQPLPFALSAADSKAVATMPLASGRLAAPSGSAATTTAAPALMATSVLARARDPTAASAAADGGESCFLRAYALETGLGGCGVDIFGAIEWYTRAAAAGFVDAPFALGQLYESGGERESDGRVLPPDLPLAIVWYEKGAAMKDLHAIERLEKLRAEAAAQ
jgi:TPR repeat protein